MEDKIKEIIASVLCVEKEKVVDSARLKEFIDGIIVHHCRVDNPKIYEANK